MNIQSGTIMVAAPKQGASKKQCIVCTGPKPQPGCEHDHAGEAFIAGVVEGVLAVLTTRTHLPGGRVPLCVDHETMLREVLAVSAQGYPEVFDKLGIEYKVA